MNDKPCVIEINGTEYYYPCDRKDNIVLIDGMLINTSSSSFTLYHDFPVYGDNTSGYPRITMPSNQSAYLRQSYNSNSYNLSVSSVEFISSRFESSVLLLIVLVGVGLCQLFKR